MKHIVVTGSTSALSESLINKLKVKFQVTTLGRRNADIIYDLNSNAEELLLPSDADVLIHVAAAMKAETDRDLLEMIEVNVKGMLKICMAVKKYKIRHLVYISSIYATLAMDSPYYTYYAMTKKQAEDVMIYYCKNNGIQFTTLRPAPIYGESDSFRANQPLLYLMADRAESGDDISIYGKVDAKRNYIHVTDLVNVIVGVLEKKLTGTFAVVYPNNYKLSEIAAAALSAFGNRGRVLFLSEKGDIEDNSFYDLGEIYNLVGTWPQVDIKKGMELICNRRRISSQCQKEKQF